MKSKFSLPAILLLITGVLLIAGIFFIGIQTRQQIQDTKKRLETFSSQADEEQKTLKHSLLSPLPFRVKKIFSIIMKRKLQQSSLSFRNTWIPTNLLQTPRLLYSIR